MTKKLKNNITLDFNHVTIRPGKAEKPSKTLGSFRFIHSFEHKRK